MSKEEIKKCEICRKPINVDDAMITSRSPLTKMTDMFHIVCYVNVKKCLEQAEKDIIEKIDDFEMKIQGRLNSGVDEMDLIIKLIRKDFRELIKSINSQDICECGHHTSDHSYNVDCSTNLECDICDCKNFEVKE